MSEYPIKPSVNICWLRRDLRLHDQAALYHALRGSRPVLCIFIFDHDILDKLEAKNDARVSFIHQTLQAIQHQLEGMGSSLLILYNTAQQAWQTVLENYKFETVFTNHDYETRANQRDISIAQMLQQHGVGFKTFKDQVIFEKDEVIKADGTPYTVYTPYQRKWYETLRPFFLTSYPTEKYFGNFYKTTPLPGPTLAEMGFNKSTLPFPDMEYASTIGIYAQKRDFPAIKGTSFIGLHLRFGTISIREAAHKANQAAEKTWLNELIWREFYMMILHHFPHTTNQAFRPEYDRIKWRNNKQEFEAWCIGQTGYPLVDAGMRQLNQTGYMHNRVRMVVASFLTKHLLINWRWGERYFAAKLLDFELASNVGGWQWAAGCGTDAAPYFRIFSPDAQTKRFDPELSYIKKWVPEYADFSKYPQPIVDHAFARQRCLAVFKEALSKS